MGGPRKSKTGAAAISRDEARRELERQRSELGPRLEGGGLSRDEAAKALALVRDTIAIETGPAGKSVARAGGLPDLPSASWWPRGKSGPLNFVAQIPLQEIAPLDVHRRLPTSGLLSFFVGHWVDDRGELHIDVSVLHVPAATTVTRQKAPEGAGKSKASSLRFQPRAMLPPYGSRLFQGDRVDGRYKRVYDELYDIGGFTNHHGMLGFARPFEDGFGPGEVILLRVDSGGIPYDFEEMSVAYFVISKEHLAARNWDAVRVHEGASI